MLKWQIGSILSTSKHRLERSTEINITKICGFVVRINLRGHLLISYKQQFCLPLLVQFHHSVYLPHISKSEDHLRGLLISANYFCSLQK